MYEDTIDGDLHQAADDFQLMLKEIARLRQVERRYNHVRNMSSYEFDRLLRWSAPLGQPGELAEAFDHLVDQGMR